MSHPPEDEWFPVVDPNTPQDEVRGRAEDSWLVGDEPAVHRLRYDLWVLVDPLVLALIGVGVAFFIGLLAAFGAFGGDSPVPAVPIIGGARPVVAFGGASNSVPTAAGTSFAAPTTTLKPGDSGTQVKALQRELVSLGFTVGAIDGSYGPATSNAVAAFQRARHLAADGVVGQATLLALSP